MTCCVLVSCMLTRCCNRDNLDVLQGELHKLSEQYSIKCLETESLRKRLELQTSMLHDSRKRAQDLIAKYARLLAFVHVCCL